MTTIFGPEGPNHYVADASAVGIVIASMADYLPALAALLSVVWFVIRIWETNTIQCWFRKIRQSDGKECNHVE